MGYLAENGNGKLNRNSGGGDATVQKLLKAFS